MLPLAIPAIATALLTLSAHVQAACYNVDGSSSSDEAFTACNPDADVSACCANDKGSRSDLCLSSGLCYAQDGNYRGFLYMNGCTDKSGAASECPHFCPDQTTDFNGGPQIKSWNVLQCNRGVFCCRAATDTENCCSNSSALVTSDIGSLLVATTAATTAATGTATTTTTSAAETTSAAGTALGGDDAASTLSLPSSSSAASSEACPKDNTAVVGGAVGGVLGAALLASLGALAFAVKRRKDNSQAPPQGWAPPHHDNSQASPKGWAPAVHNNSQASPQSWGPVVHDNSQASPQSWAPPAHDNSEASTQSWASPVQVKAEEQNYPPPAFELSGQGQPRHEM